MSRILSKNVTDEGFVYHTHDCSQCCAGFDYVAEERLSIGICPIDMCRRCRERVHATSDTADLMPNRLLRN